MINNLPLKIPLDSLPSSSYFVVINGLMLDNAICVGLFAILDIILVQYKLPDNEGTIKA